jgi:hypothetical protein
MTTHTRSGIAFLAIAASLPVLANAAGLGFLKNSPMYYFTDEDMKMLYDTAKTVLNDPDPTAARDWVNPKSKYSGKIESLGAFKSTTGLKCRKVRVSTQAKGIDNVAIYPVCQTADGQWKLASGLEPGKP